MSIPPREDVEGWTIFVCLLLAFMMCLSVGIILALGDPRA